MIAQIQMRRGTTAEWAAAAPVVLAAGEPGYDSTLKGMKIGDGATEWASLPWADAINNSDIDADKLDGSHLADVLLAIYPVGAIYMSVVSTSPATLFGGTWSAWGAGRVPVGIDAGQTEFDTAEETGGAKTHTLQTTEMPEHTHPMVYGANATTVNVLAWASTNDSFPGMTTGSAGGGGAHNNLQPYIVCYMWKRTA